MDRLADPIIRSAAACIRHGRINVGIRWIREALQQGERTHDHSGLAVAALRRIEFFPGGLDRMIAVRGESFDGGDLLADGGVRRGAAGADCLTVDKHCACAALADTTSEFGSRQTDMLADDPQQWRLWFGIYGKSRFVHIQVERH